MSIQIKPAAKHIQPKGFSGRLEAIRVPTRLGKARRSSGSRRRPSCREPGRFEDILPDNGDEHGQREPAQRPGKPRSGAGAHRTGTPMLDALPSGVHGAITPLLSRTTVSATLRGPFDGGEQEPTSERPPGGGKLTLALLGSRVVAHVGGPGEAAPLRELLWLLDPSEGAVKHLFVDRVGQIESTGERPIELLIGEGVCLVLDHRRVRFAFGPQVVDYQGNQLRLLRPPISHLYSPRFVVFRRPSLQRGPRRVWPWRGEIPGYAARLVRRSTTEI